MCFILNLNDILFILQLKHYIIAENKSRFLYQSFVMYAFNTLSNLSQSKCTTKILEARESFNVMIS